MHDMETLKIIEKSNRAILLCSCCLNPFKMRLGRWSVISFILALLNRAYRYFYPPPKYTKPRQSIFNTILIEHALLITNREMERLEQERKTQELEELKRKVGGYICMRTDLLQNSRCKCYAF